MRAERAIANERRAFARSTAGRQARAGVLDVAGGCAVYTGDGLFSNRAFALGLTDAIQPVDLDRIEAFYAERDLPTEIEVASVADPSLIRLLANRRYQLRRFRNIFVHGLEQPLPTIPVGMNLRPVDGDGAAWSATLVAGFGYDQADDVERIEEWNDALLATPGLTALTADFGAETLGSASVLIDGGAAVLGGAATRPEHRRQGVQSALIAARLRLAAEAGCELAVVTADPGSSSARNSERAGFRLVCTHAVMRRGS